MNYTIVLTVLLQVKHIIQEAVMEENSAMTNLLRQFSLQIVMQIWGCDEIYKHERVKKDILLLHLSSVCTEAQRNSPCTSLTTSSEFSILAVFIGSFFTSDVTTWMAISYKRRFNSSGFRYK